MKRIFALLASPLLLVVPIVAAGGELEAVPADVVRAGRQQRCLVPSQKLAGVVTAWVREREAGTAYAAWCARQSAGGPVYDLVVSATAAHPWGRCPAHIRLGIAKPFPHFRARMLPRDLPYAIELGEFWYVRGDDYLSQGPPVRGSGPPQGPALDIGYEDAGQILVCFEGSWIMAGYH